MNAWQPVMTTETISRYTVVLSSANGKERKTVYVLAGNMENAEQHAQNQFPTMHVIDSDIN